MGKKDPREEKMNPHSMGGFMFHVAECEAWDKRDREHLIVEEVHGNFHYHIAKCETFTKSLCGKNITMMQTAIPYNSWGIKSHLKEQWCEDCKRLFDGVIE